MKPRTVKLLRGFAFVWTGLVGGLVAVGMVGIWMSEGFGRVQDVFSPFNIINTATVIVALLPALGAYALAEKLEKGAATEQPKSNLEESIQLIQKYGAVLEAASATKAVAVDVDRLPASKDEIKAAILRVLRSDEYQDMHTVLKTGYVDLSMFQPGVGSEPIRMLPIPDPIPDPHDDEAIRAAVEAISEVGDEVLRWSNIVNEEMHRLVDELKEAGFWNE